jgi:hypothetical protein
VGVRVGVGEGVVVGVLVGVGDGVKVGVIGTGWKGVGVAGVGGKSVDVGSTRRGTAVMVGVVVSAAGNGAWASRMPGEGTK